MQTSEMDILGTEMKSGYIFLLKHFLNQHSYVLGFSLAKQLIFLRNHIFAFQEITELQFFQDKNVVSTLDR